jgi:hypothetical protein
MDKRTYAEVEVLDRIIDMLEEHSVSRLAEEDHNFSAFIEHLYETVNDKASTLQVRAVE